MDSDLAAQLDRLETKLDRIIAAVEATAGQPERKARPAVPLIDLEKMYEEADGPNRDSSHLPIAGGGYT